MVMVYIGMYADHIHPGHLNVIKKAIQNSERYSLMGTLAERVES